MKTSFAIWNLHDGYGEVTIVGRDGQFPSSALRLLADPYRIPPPNHRVEVELPVLMWGSADEVSQDVREMVLASLDD